MATPQKARLTGIRREIKYLVDPASGHHVLAQFLQKIPTKEVEGNASSFRVSIYLDTKTRRFSNAELENQSVVTKLRLREYYLLADSVPIFGDKCYLEVKTRSGQMVEKARFSISRKDISASLREGAPIPTDADERTAREAFEEMRNGFLLEPIFVVHYRRFTLQDKDARIRITLDDMLSYHMSPEALVSSDVPRCARKDLPPPFLVEPNWIIEAKILGAPPLWLDNILSPDRQIQYSKFGAGVRALKRNSQLLPRRL